MDLKRTAIPDIKILCPKKFEDKRGFFSETFNKEVLQSLGINLDFVQDNQSLSVEKGVLRGLHIQTPPFAQDKLVRVVKGSILDVAVDIRKNSPYYGKHVSIVLSADNWKQILVPVGFAHGFLTLEENTEVIYKVTNFYSPENDRGVIWNDKDLAIDWGIPEKEIILSEKDEGQPSFSVLGNYFP